MLRWLLGKRQRNNTETESVLEGTALNECRPPAYLVNRINEIPWKVWHDPADNTVVIDNVSVEGIMLTNADGVSRQEILSRMVRWEAVELVPEPSNPCNPGAVAVHGGMGQIGYIDPDVAVGVARLLDRGGRAFCKLSEHGQARNGGSWDCKLEIHISLPR